MEAAEADGSGDGAADGEVGELWTRDEAVAQAVRMQRKYRRQRAKLRRCAAVLAQQVADAEAAAAAAATARATAEAAYLVAADARNTIAADAAAAALARHVEESEFWEHNARVRQEEAVELRRANEASRLHFQMDASRREQSALQAGLLAEAVAMERAQLRAALERVQREAAALREDLAAMQAVGSPLTHAPTHPSLL